MCREGISRAPSTPKNIGVIILKFLSAKKACEELEAAAP
jgi:hypothetical protein